jgi:hypothetical protein
MLYAFPVFSIFITDLNQFIQSEDVFLSTDLINNPDTVSMELHIHSEEFKPYHEEIRFRTIPKLHNDAIPTVHARMAQAHVTEVQVT